MEFNDRRPGKGLSINCPLCSVGAAQKEGYTIPGHNTPVCADCEYEIEDTYRDAGYPMSAPRKPLGYDQRRKSQRR